MHIFQEPPDGRWAILVVAAVFLAGAGWYAFRFKIRKVDGATADGELTETQYRKLRKVFEDSHHADIKAAGTTMMDVLWQLSGLGPTAGLEALPHVTQVMNAITDLQGACADHGIVLDVSTS